MKKNSTICVFNPKNDHPQVLDQCVTLSISELIIRRDLIQKLATVWPVPKTCENPNNILKNGQYFHRFKDAKAIDEAEKTCCRYCLPGKGDTQIRWSDRYQVMILMVNFTEPMYFSKASQCSAWTCKGLRQARRCCFWKCNESLNINSMRDRHKLHRKCVSNLKYAICREGFMRLFEVDTEYDKIINMNLFNGNCTEERCGNLNKMGSYKKANHFLDFKHGEQLKYKVLKEKKTPLIIVDDEEQIKFRTPANTPGKIPGDVSHKAKNVILPKKQKEFKKYKIKEELKLTKEEEDFLEQQKKENEKLKAVLLQRLLAKNPLLNKETLERDTLDDLRFFCKGEKIPTGFNEIPIKIENIIFKKESKSQIEEEKELNDDQILENYKEGLQQKVRLKQIDLEEYQTLLMQSKRDPQKIIEEQRQQNKERN